MHRRLDENYFNHTVARARAKRPALARRYVDQCTIFLRMGFTIDELAFHADPKANQRNWKRWSVVPVVAIEASKE